MSQQYHRYSRLLSQVLSLIQNFSKSNKDNAEYPVHTPTETDTWHPKEKQIVFQVLVSGERRKSLVFK